MVSPRGPLQLEGWPGYHWYLVPRVGYPDPETFFAARAALAALHDRLWEETGVGPERTVLGGFSMGAVMSHALGWSGDRPAVAGVLAFSGFVPTVEGWEPSLADRAGDPRLRRPRRPRPGDRRRVRPRRPRPARARAASRSPTVESAVAHQIDPARLAAATGWLAETLDRLAARRLGAARGGLGAPGGGRVRPLHAGAGAVAGGQVALEARRGRSRAC